MADSADDAERQAVVSSGLLRHSDDVDVDCNPAFDLQCSGWDTKNEVPIPAKKRLSLTFKNYISDKHTPPI